MSVKTIVRRPSSRPSSGSTRLSRKPSPRSRRPTKAKPSPYTFSPPLRVRVTDERGTRIVEVGNPLESFCRCFLEANPHAKVEPLDLVHDGNRTSPQAKTSFRFLDHLARTIEESQQWMEGSHGGMVGEGYAPVKRIVCGMIAAIVNQVIESIDEAMGEAHKMPEHTSKWDLERELERRNEIEKKAATRAATSKRSKPAA